MRLLIILLLSTCLSSTCFADRLIRPIASDDQMGFIRKDQTFIVSSKLNNVWVCSESEATEENSIILFKFENRSSMPIHFTVHDLSITDEWGREIPVKAKNEFLDTFEKGEKNLYDLVEIAESHALREADKAGDRQLNAISNKKYETHKSKKKKSHKSRKRKHSSKKTSTVESPHSEVLRQEARQQAYLEADQRRTEIAENLNPLKDYINGDYLTSKIVFPRQSYEPFIFIDIPLDTEYLFFTIDFGERHQFCFKCEKAKNKSLR